MPAPRKPQKSATRAEEPVTIDATPALPAPVAETTASPALPVLKETLEVSLGKVADLQEQIRQVTEESLEKSKRVYARSREVAEDATSSIGASFKAVSQGMTDLNVKTVEALQASADAQFAFVKALLATKSLSEIVALQGEHLRQQFETLNAAAKDVSNLIHKVSTESVEPLKTTISKSLKIAA